MGAVALLLGTVYVPGVADVLEVQPPTLEGWGVIALMSLVPLGVGQGVLLMRTYFRASSEEGHRARNGPRWTRSGKKIRFPTVRKTKNCRQVPHEGGAWLVLELFGQLSDAHRGMSQSGEATSHPKP